MSTTNPIPPQPGSAPPVPPGQSGSWLGQPGWVPPPPEPPVQRGSFRRGFGAGAGAGLGVGLVGLTGILVAALLIAGLVGVATAGGAESPTRTLWGEAKARNTVKAFEITGTILASPSDGATLGGGVYGYEIAAQIDAVDATESAGLLLVMNTPGGTINGSRAIADAVSRYQKRTGKKVVAFVQGMSASGGMYAMAGADQIIADHGSLVGSIGVIMGPFERYRDVTAITGTILTPGVETRGGIQQEYLTMGRGKDFGNPFRDMSAEERKVMMGGLQNIYDDFVSWVAKGRDLDPKVITEQLGAHIFDPAAALANGLIDAELGIDEGYRKAAEILGVDPADTRFVAPSQPGLLEQLLGVQSRVPGHHPALRSGDTTAAGVCGRTPVTLMFHGEPAGVCR